MAARRPSPASPSLWRCGWYRCDGGRPRSLPVHRSATGVGRDQGEARAGRGRGELAPLPRAAGILAHEGNGRLQLAETRAPAQHAEIAGGEVDRVEDLVLFERRQRLLLPVRARVAAEEQLLVAARGRGRGEPGACRIGRAEALADGPLEGVAGQLLLRPGLAGVARVDEPVQRQPRQITPPFVKRSGSSTRASSSADSTPSSSATSRIERSLAIACLTIVPARS